MNIRHCEIKMKANKLNMEAENENPRTNELLDYCIQSVVNNIGQRLLSGEGGLVWNIGIALQASLLGELHRRP